MTKFQNIFYYFQRANSNPPKSIHTTSTKPPAISSFIHSSICLPSSCISSTISSNYNVSSQKSTITKKFISICIICSVIITASSTKYSNSTRIRNNSDPNNPVDNFYNDDNYNNATANNHNDYNAIATILWFTACSTIIRSS